MEEKGNREMSEMERRMEGMRGRPSEGKVERGQIVRLVARWSV